MSEFHNFDLRVSGSEGVGYTIQARGPADEWVSAPLDDSLLADLKPDLAAIRAGLAAPGGLERAGGALFQVLFPPPVMRLYVAAQARLGEHDSLRLRLHLPPELAALPWELLYDPPRFLCLDAKTSVVRFLDLPDPPPPLAVEPPLRLLHLVASPQDAPPLETGQIASALAELGQAGKVEILPGGPGTLATLQDRLRQGCHILHFSGHGGFSGEEGFLLFEDESGYGRPVNATLLAQYLRVPALRLAVLNACESAMASTGDAFSSVAAALVQQAGLPAVIAYQRTMPNSSAIPFATGFYAALADGYPVVDEAVTEGRKAILTALGEAWCEQPDWATPLLFLCTPDGYLWRPESQALATRTAVLHIETVRDSTLDFRPLFAPVPGLVPTPAVDPLLTTLDELRTLVRDRAPQEKRTEALEKVATLRGAATERRPNLALLESVWKWFDAELPGLSGAVLSAILEVKPRLQELGDELVWDFEGRFGP